MEDLSCWDDPWKFAEVDREKRRLICEMKNNSVLKDSDPTKNFINLFF